MDRFAEKFPWQSPYVHAGNNPVNFVDVNGDSLTITGELDDKVLEQAQAKAGKSVTAMLNH
jgi:hypothetical protein